MNSLRITGALLIALLVAGCGGGGSVGSRDEPQPVASATPENTIGDAASFTPNGFLSFVNEYRSLAAGPYEVIVGTRLPGEVGTFSLKIEFDDGSVVDRSGSWTEAMGGGADAPDHPGNPRIDVQLSDSGGLSLEVDSASEAVLFLVRNGQVLTRVENSLLLLASQINSAEFAQAYYTLVDPLGDRGTLSAWKALNGFGSGGPDSEINTTFRDAKDLGYGRDMHARERQIGGVDCGLAIYEDNYVVQLEPGDSSTYGPMNLDAAVERNRRFLAGTNALEFGPLSAAECADPSRWVVTFYTFGRPDETGEQTRLDEVDFDGRGLKFMPGICVVCHGGTLNPLDINGDLTDLTIKSSTFNVLNPASLEFSSQLGFTFEEQSEGIAAVNDLVRKVYQHQATRTDTSADVANWSADFALEWLDGLMQTPIVQFSEFVPAGWQQEATLYKAVIEPYCLGCHSNRGTQVGEANAANAANFSSWEKFIAFQNESVDYVYRRGKMPLSLIGYSKFWEDPDAPRLLADALGLADSFRASPGGRPLEPGRAVAKPGADRTVFIPPQGQRVLDLDGSASYFSTGFTWQVVQQPAGAAPVLSGERDSVARLTAYAAGDYTVRLTTANTEGNSVPAEVTITFSSDMLDDRETVFAASGDQQASISIIDLFGTASCTGCHVPIEQSDLTGIPVYFTADAYDDKRAFYQAVMAQVDLADPENSRILTKPLAANPRHGGGQVLSDDPSDLRYPHYQMLLNWIRAGAPCGGDADFCSYARIEVAPAAPTNLTAEALESATQVRLSWRDNSVNETSFVVERSLSVDSGFVAVATLGSNPEVSVNHLDSGLAPETTYYHRVRARNSASNNNGFSAYSNTTQVTTPVAPIQAPVAPAALAAAAWSDSQIRLTWNAVNTAAGYTIVRGLGAGEIVATVAASVTEFLDGGRAPLTTHSYRVRAFNDGGTSPDSNADSATTVASGATLYGSNCESCHGPLATSLKPGRSFEQIRAAIISVLDMNALSGLSDPQVRAIADALAP